jgi:acetyltransferase-like isoleucine patch superfamily enzyme
MTWQKPVIAHMIPTHWQWVVSHPDKLELGNNTDIGAFTYIMAAAGVTIEDDVQIGSHCSLHSVSTIDNKTGKITIRKGARIGSHTAIMPGVTVGEGAIVGACSFVNRNIPAGETWFGVPARKKK